VDNFSILKEVPKNFIHCVCEPNFIILSVFRDGQ